jgi:hypothetical protein
MSDGGKGDRKRPLVISEQEFNKNWDAIFNKQDKYVIDNQEDAKYQKIVSKEIADEIDVALGIKK